MNHYLVKLSKIITILLLVTSPVFLRASLTTQTSIVTSDDGRFVGNEIVYDTSSAPSISPRANRNDDRGPNDFDPDKHERSLEKRKFDTFITNQMNPRIEQQKQPQPQEDDVIVIATLDGTFYGISSLNGNIIWKSKASSLDSKVQSGKTTSPKITMSKQEENLFSPLLSTTTTRTNNKSWRTAAVPSMDGRVFLTLGKSVKDTITSNVRELVERSPFMDTKGRFFVSNKNGYAVAINKFTGEVIRTVASEKGVLEKDQLVYLDKGDAFLWVGRVDYQVTVHDARTGEVDVQFSTSEVLGVEDMMQNSSIDRDYNDEKLGIKAPFESSNPTNTMGISMKDTSSALTKAMDRNYKPLTNVFEREQERHQISENDYLSSIVATPGGRFAKLHPDSNQIIWIADQTLSSSVVFAIQATGESLSVHIVPDAPTSNSFSNTYIMSELDRQSQVSQDRGSSVFDDETVFGALPNGELFAIPLGSRSKRVTSLYNGLPHVPRLASSIGSSKNLSSKIPYMSVHGDLLSSAKESTALTTVLKTSPCDQYSTNFAECLRSTYGALFGDSEEIPYEDKIDAVDLFSKEYQSKTGRKRSNFVRIMTSWLPPVVALIFVLSFELGRREKARVIAKESSTASITFKRELSDEDLKSDKYHTGVISVSERVLGYGGHGTVVYKGKLDGRFVAVKRMLKAYHASADREISLLIESDGHPNVVRYFLKEIRGDFVYLALELCDMSLQDLIGVLSKYRLKIPIEESSSIHKATRKILFEIASGVKHIHSLRIVHRDLKPANILVARSSRKSKVSQPIDDDEMYRIFEAGEYIPKISDMGLGKQLAGHSSFGFSTFNSMGPDLMGNDASTIAGAGPGSVGWQAPEVMAQRLTPESIFEDSSGPESWLEASPIDISLNTRTSRSVDIFSLGCIFYCTLLPGSHPFGQWYEREANIMKGNTATDPLKDLSMEAWDLVTSMLSRNPGARPTAAQICIHPFFWSPTKRLSFLCEFSDRLETEVDSTNHLYLLDKLVVERQAHKVVGTSWETSIDSRLLNNVQKFRTYDTSSVRDCLRLLRNKHHHFDELPLDLRESIIPTQTALLEYFEEKFPKLFYHCYSLCRENLRKDDPLIVKYDIARKLPVIFMSNDKNNTSKLSSLSSDQNKISDQKAVSTPILDEPDLKQDEEHVETFCDDMIQVSDAGPMVTSDIEDNASKDIIIWQNSTASNALCCRGWIRSEDEWVRRSSEKARKRDPNLVRCVEDSKFRTRLCNHWETSNGVNCPMLKKYKCIFAHHPSELRVKDGKRRRWGKLVDAHGNANNPFSSGGEDTYGAAKTIESARKDEGKWKVPSVGKKKKHLNRSNGPD